MLSRIHKIQEALKQEKLDGWLLFDFKRSNPLANDILQLDSTVTRTRRWFYFIPARGTPTKLVHRIETSSLDSLPGQTRLYAEWKELVQELRILLSRSKRVAMEYSHKGEVPYISRVDGGTVELIRSLGVRVATSGNLIQFFESRITPEQIKDHQRTAGLLHHFVQKAFHKVA
ncbi:MAG: aminopeptidase P family protein, partial [Elusimicrobia bacterium]|nr:aminopeptidase P family protein [Elusimicrobiota bacterium]